MHPIGPHNLIARQVFNEVDVYPLVGLKTNTGWDLAKATLSAQTMKQHVGIYAGDDESYSTFSDVFNEVIRYYHNVDVTKNQAVPEDYAPKSPPELPPEGADAIKSTRIRTARNLAGFPFTNNMSAEQRLEVENILKTVFEGFTDERLQGTYYSIASMSEEQQQELINAHYMFTTDDVCLETIGTYDDWPTGRGIFMNDKRDEFGIFIVWVGEEDQMRIMAMNKGSDCNAIWDLFYSGLQAVHEGVKAQGHDFAFLESHGYLATCPTNLGTGMRASVHVNLPGFKTKQSVKDFVKGEGMAVDIRGTHGESKNTDGVTIYDVSNKARLGSDCFEQIQAMVDGVKTLLEASNWRLERAKPWKFFPDGLDTTKWASHTLSAQIFDRYNISSEIDLESETGWNLSKATLNGQKLKGQHIALYAGDAGCYDLYPKVYTEAIKRYHKVDVTENVQVAEDYAPRTPPQLPAEGANNIVSTRIRTARNIDGLPYTCNMTAEQRLEVEATLQKVFEGFTDERLKGKYYSMATMSIRERKELIAAHYLYIDDDPALKLVGTYDDWPAGRGIFINDARDDVGTFIVWVGEEDHMRIMAMAKGSDCIAIWNLFYNGLQAVHEGVRAQGLDFAFSENLGYLATCVTNIGTGMRASVHVDLPNFKTKQSVKDYVKERGLQIDIRGTQGESKNTDGITIYDVSNKARLGSDCFTQLQTMVDGVSELLQASASMNTAETN